MAGPVVGFSALYSLECFDTVDCNNNNNNNVRLFDWRHNAQSTVTSATQGGTRLYTEELSSVNCCHTWRTAIDNRTDLTLWTLTRWRNQHTSDKVAHYSIYWHRKDERLSWPSQLNYSGWLTHICGHSSATGRLRDRESSPVKDRPSTTVPRGDVKDIRRVKNLCHLP